MQEVPKAGRSILMLAATLRADARFLADRSRSRMPPHAERSSGRTTPRHRLCPRSQELALREPSQLLDGPCAELLKRVGDRLLALHAQDHLGVLAEPSALKHETDITAEELSILTR